MPSPPASYGLQGDGPSSAPYPRPGVPPGPPAGVPTRHTRRGLVLISVAGIAVVVVLALLLLGILPSPLHPAGSGEPNGSSGSCIPAAGGPDVSYAKARSVSDGCLAGTSGGPWTLVLSYGTALQHSYAYWASNSTSSSCGFGPSSRTIYQPAEAGPLSGGDAATWGFIYSNYRGEWAVTLVINGSIVAGTPVTEPSSCHFDVGGGLNGTYLDSSSAASVVVANGGSAFEQHYSPSMVQFQLGNWRNAAVGLVGALWEVSIQSACVSGGPSSYALQEFTGFVNATSDSLVTSTNQTVMCTPAAVIHGSSGASLGVGPSVIAPASEVSEKGRSDGTLPVSPRALLR